MASYEDTLLNHEDKENLRRKPFIIGVSGGTASGKTSVCDKIIHNLKNQRVAIISQDSFYKSLTQEEIHNVKTHNFDHPDSFDWNQLMKVLQDIKQGKSTQIPIYSFKTHQRENDTTELFGRDVILFEGILAFFSKEIRDLMDLKIFVDTDADTRLARRVKRDIEDRGRTLESVLTQYDTFVKPAFEDYILPTKKFADVIIPRGVENEIAIDLIVQHIRTKLGPKHL